MLKLLALANKPNTDEIFNPAIPLNLNQMKGPDYLQKFISTGISLIFIVGSLIFFFMLIQGAIMWITSRGDAGGHPVKDPGPLVFAKKQITAALIGLALLMLAYAIINLFKTIFGVDIIKFSIPTLI